MLYFIIHISDPETDCDVKSLAIKGYFRLLNGLAQSLSKTTGYLKVGLRQQAAKLNFLYSFLVFTAVLMQAKFVSAFIPDEDPSPLAITSVPKRQCISKHWRLNFENWEFLSSMNFQTVSVYCKG